MTLVDDLYQWTDFVLRWGLVVLLAWAFGDCAARKAAAFPAVNKLTKPAWLAIIVLAGVFGAWLPPGPPGPIYLIATVCGSVYLADVRPAVKEISGNR